MKREPNEHAVVNSSVSLLLVTFAPSIWQRDGFGRWQYPLTDGLPSGHSASMQRPESGHPSKQLQKEQPDSALDHVALYTFNNVCTPLIDTSGAQND